MTAAPCARQRPLLWEWEGRRIVGMLHLPADGRTPALAALLLPGGAQTRSGAGRGLLALARTLAACGVPALAFDWAGQGDSEGGVVPFDRRGPQIACARRALARATGLARHALLGICDGASAALIHAGEEDPAPGLAGLVLVNCWMRDDDLAPPRGWFGLALARRLARDRRAAGGDGVLRPGSPGGPGGLPGLFASLRRARAREEGRLEARLRGAAARCPAPILWVIARADPTGRDALVRLRHPRWRTVAPGRGDRRLLLGGGDHGLLDPRSRLAVTSALLRMVEPGAVPAAPRPA